MLFPENLGSHLSLDEVNISNGELYTVLTNKKGKGKKGSLVAMVKGTKSSVVTNILSKIPFSQRLKVQEVTCDMAGTMNSIINDSFLHAVTVIDRFHVQQLVGEAVQKIRIDLRWEAIEKENFYKTIAKEKGKVYKDDIMPNGETRKQLLARSRHLLSKPSSKWTDSQKERAEIVFGQYPKLNHAYHLSMNFRNFYESSKTRKEGQERLHQWYKKVQEKKDVLPSFLVASESIKHFEHKILSFFDMRSTNASAESFNSKIKNFRALLRGVTDKNFFLFRLHNIFV